MRKDQYEAIDLHQESYVGLCSHHSNLGLLKGMDKLGGSRGNQKQFQETAFQIRYDSLQITVPNAPSHFDTSSRRSQLSPCS